jgi:hypothetical protein
MPTTLSELIPIDHVPTSFGVFKPVGWVMVGLPDAEQAVTLAVALQGAGWPSSEVLHFVPCETESQLQAMADKSSGLAGFGSEITLLRRYVQLTHEGVRWLLVKVVDKAQAAEAAELARHCAARLAVHYRALTVEELI